MYEAFKKYVPRMATPEMTAQLEAEMDQIAAGEMTKDASSATAASCCTGTWSEIDESREDLAKVVWAGMDQDRILGPCKVCEEPAARRRTARPHAARDPREKVGQALRRLQRLDLDDPDSCDQTFPLPQRGDVFKLEERCSICGETPRLKVVPFRGRPWNLCLNDDCESMQEMKKRRAEREAAKAAKAAMEKKAPPKGDEDAAPKKAKVKASKADTATARAQTRQSRR
jgi:DNA topoisomerase-1